MCYMRSNCEFLFLFIDSELEEFPHGTVSDSQVMTDRSSTYYDSIIHLIVVQSNTLYRCETWYII